MSTAFEGFIPLNGLYQRENLGVNLDYTVVLSSPETVCQKVALLLQK